MLHASSRLNSDHAIDHALLVVIIGCGTSCLTFVDPGDPTNSTTAGASDIAETNGVSAAIDTTTSMSMGTTVDATETTNSTDSGSSTTAAMTTGAPGTSSTATDGSTGVDGCGDGELQPGEECDDGNDVSGDGCEDDCSNTPIYNAFGPQTNVPESELIGWEICWASTYSNSGTSLNAIINSNCTRENLMLACREVDSDTYTLLAHAPRNDVTFNTGQGNTPKIANGSGWYFSESWSWGFAKQGDPILRTPCDTQDINAAERLCWQTSGGNTNSGYRCGASVDLLGNSWERVILHAE